MGSRGDPDSTRVKVITSLMLSSGKTEPKKTILDNFWKSQEVKFATKYLKSTTRQYLTRFFCYFHWNALFYSIFLYNPKSYCISLVLVYDVMKGWGPVSMSAGLLFPYHETVEQMFETTSNHYSGASNTKFVQKKWLWRKKHHYHHYYHHRHHPHHRHHHHCHYHQFYHHYHSLSAPPSANPVWGPFGMKKTHYNHHRHRRHHHNHHHDHQHHHNHHCHRFSSPLWWRLCLRSFGSKISHFPSSRLVTFQHKIDFQPRRLSSFLKKKQEIMLVFSKTC